MFHIMIDYYIQPSCLTCIMILISWLCIYCRWLVLLSMHKCNIEWSFYHYITNSRGGMFPIMNNYWFWFFFTNYCVYILTFSPYFISLSVEERRRGHRNRDNVQRGISWFFICCFLHVLLSLSLNMTMLCTHFPLFCNFFFSFLVVWYLVLFVGCSKRKEGSREGKWKWQDGG